MLHSCLRDTDCTCLLLILQGCVLQSEARTYQDLLKDQHDEDSFEHFTSVAIVSIKVTAHVTCCSAQEQSTLLNLLHL